MQILFREAFLNETRHSNSALLPTPAPPISELLSLLAERLGKVRKRFCQRGTASTFESEVAPWRPQV